MGHIFLGNHYSLEEFECSHDPVITAQQQGQARDLSAFLCYVHCYPGADMEVLQNSKTKKNVNKILPALRVVSGVVDIQGCTFTSNWRAIEVRPGGTLRSLTGTSFKGNGALLR